MLNHQGTQPLKTGRLLLRRITPGDAAAVYRWMRDPEVCKYERWSPHPSREYSAGYIRAVFCYDDLKTYQWGIEREGELIGSVSVVNVDDGDEKAVLGYCLRRSEWSKGYMTEAVSAVLRYMFETVGLNRMEASHSVNNPASGRVLEKCGFTLEGFCKDYYRCNAGWQDSRIYGLTRRDWRRKQR